MDSLLKAPRLNTSYRRTQYWARGHWVPLGSDSSQGLHIYHRHLSLHTFHVILASMLSINHHDDPWWDIYIYINMDIYIYKGIYIYFVTPILLEMDFSLPADHRNLGWVLARPARWSMGTRRRLPAKVPVASTVVLDQQPGFRIFWDFDLP